MLVKKVQKVKVASCQNQLIHRGPVSSAGSAASGSDSFVQTSPGPSHLLLEELQIRTHDPGLTVRLFRSQTAGGAAGSSSQSPPAAAASDESFCIVVSVDPLDDSFHSEPEFTSIISDESDEDMDKDCTIVYNQNLMELFRTCQTCGQPIVEKEAFHSGAQMRVKWSCDGGHSGTWKSSPHLRDVRP